MSDWGDTHLGYLYGSFGHKSRYVMACHAAICHSLSFYLNKKIPIIIISHTQSICCETIEKQSNDL